MSEVFAHEIRVVVPGTGRSVSLRDLLLAMLEHQGLTFEKQPSRVILKNIHVSKK